MRPFLFVSPVVSLLVAAACAGSVATVPAAGPCSASAGGFRTGTSGGVTIWVVNATATDACITQRADSHVVFRASALSPTDRLFVFLPGTGAIPQQYQLIALQAALAGYHAIGLSYPNDTSVSTLCATQSSQCYGTTRLEILTGQNTSTVVTVDRANSIENRLVKLLQFMRSKEPAGNWGQYLTADTAVTWSKVSLAGHSQGGGHALFLAQRHTVWRATMFSSYGDYLPNSPSPAPWVTQPYATEGSRLFGFISTADEFISPVTALATWSAIGMSGGVVNVDVTVAPYGIAQRFVTTQAPANPSVVIGPNHNVVVLDVNTPKVTFSSAPLFASVWRALSFP